MEESQPHVELSTTFGLEASHPATAGAGDQCVQTPANGHSWRIDVAVAGSVDPAAGWLIDYHDIEAAWTPIHEALDHRHLNDVDGLENPTSELLAVWIWNRLEPRLGGLCSVTVHETCTARCTYFGPRKAAGAQA